MTSRHTRRSPFEIACALVAATWMGLAPSPGHADSSEWNLHLEPAFAVPVLGMLEPAERALVGAGFVLWGALDWQPLPPLAFELLAALGHAEHLGTVPGADATLLSAALGARLRFAQDESGYASDPGGNAEGGAWISAHVGAMAWHGPQLSIDLGWGYEWSVLDPFSLGLFARGVLGFLGDDGNPDLVVAVGLSGSFEVHAGAIPPGRWGVSDVRIEGLEHLDDAALRACLGTRQRERLGLDVGASSDLACGEPPFDARRLRIDLFSWPWTEWPLFDASVFERDVERVERWLRARGYYEGRVLASTVEPPEAIGATAGAPTGPSDDRCLSDERRGCPVAITFRVEEGEPVRVARVEVRGETEIDRDLRRRLRAVLQLRRGDVFDEALYERTRQAMVRVLADDGHPDARVRGEVKINVERHEAFLLFVVHPGPRGVIGRICVVGHGELPPEPILAATYLEPGEPFRLVDLEEAQRAIFALGTLSSVEIRHTSAAPDAAPPTAASPDGESARAERSVSDPPPLIDPEASPAAAPGARVETSEAGPREVRPEPARHCIGAPTEIPDGARTVDLEIRVAPGRLERLGLGVGLQIGDTLRFGSTGASSTSSLGQQSLQQWDVHLLLVAEWRNLFGDMLRLRLEERPRVIFPAPFPAAVSESGLGPSFGNALQLNVRWPAFLEPRTALFASVGHEYGPLPLYGFFRHELDGRLGLERTFLDGRLYLSAAVRGNLFVPDQGQGLRIRSQRETTRALILEQVATLDLRDDPRNPTQGAFFAVGLQEAGAGGVSSWDYLRITAEGRGYIPLGLGVVLAMRFGVGAMILGDRYGLDPDNVYDLYDLGPVSQQLQGGGAVSNRGVPAGLLGDVLRRRVEARPTPAGDEPSPQPILVSGGIRRWEGSLELRIPITPELGTALFADVGNVSRSEDFHFDVLNFACGIGLRYRTPIGPLRFDWALRPDALQWVGSGVDPRPPACDADRPYECRPVHRLFGAIPGAIHLTIGEAF